jgi:hypothetical protein
MQVRFDTNPEQLNHPLSTDINEPDVGPSLAGTPAQPRRDQIQDWINGLTPESVPTNVMAHGPPPLPTLAPIRPDPNVDGAVATLLQSLINEFKGLKEGLETQQTALAVEASNQEARRMAAAAPGALGADTGAGKSPVPDTTAVEVEDKDGKVIQQLKEKQKKRKTNRVIYGVARVAERPAFFTVGTMLSAQSKVTLAPCISASGRMKLRMLGWLPRVSPGLGMTTPNQGTLGPPVKKIRISRMLLEDTCQLPTLLRLELPSLWT